MSKPLNKLRGYTNQLKLKLYEDIFEYVTKQIYTHLHNESLMNAMQGHPMSKFKINDALTYNY